MEQEPAKHKGNKANRNKWLKRIGIAGFLFFLIKGLAWIGLIVFASKGCK